MTRLKNPNQCCDSEPVPCPTRRQVVAGLGGVLASSVAPPLPAMAGPFDENEYRKAIPADKKLDAAWVKSLFERGEKQTFTGDELTYIGMPVGGIGAGLVYLGGDGRLWMWDVFNRPYARGFMGRGAGGDTYLRPFEPVQPFVHGFELRTVAEGKTDTRTLDSAGFSDVRFDGRYPMGIVNYKDPSSAVAAKLEAFSPFVPLDLDNSSYPATVMRYTLTNTSDKPIEAAITGWIDNPVCLYTGRPVDTQRRNTLHLIENATAVQCSAEKPTAGPKIAKRPDIVFEDFEKPTYEGWQVAGEAFGKGPIAIADIADYQGDVAGVGKRVVNSHASAPGADIAAKDAATGSLLSKPFKIERNYIACRIGGGKHGGGQQHARQLLDGEKPNADESAGTSINLLIDGKMVRSIRGHEANKMRPDSMDVSALRGKTARLMIVDAISGAWGNIGIDQIVFTDEASKPDAGPIEKRHDYGTFALAAVGGADGVNVSAERDNLFARNKAADAIGPHGQPLIAALNRTVKLEPGESKTVTFIVAWHFANLKLQNMGEPGRAYATRFKDAAAVASHVAKKYDALYEQTRRWVDTWYDSTLPHWLLDRAMANTSILATTTCYLFADGRFYGWEGINCCPGTCTHVWHYAQAPGRLFPQIERGLRSRIDFGIGQHPSGAVSHRTYADKGTHHADDGHCGRVLGMYREHQMSADDGFLRELWPNVKRAIEFMFTRDPDWDGILDGAQPNTLDAAWFGRISFTSSLHIAAMRAGEEMAAEMGDAALAGRCRAVAAAGAESMLTLYNGEYFYQIEDPKHRDKIGAGTGCYIDQIFGQTWAHWTGLGNLFDRDSQLTALRSLWKYNFVPEIGPFREHFKHGRWYASAGDAGLIMCSWPRESVDPKKKKHWQYGYFNECMTGFEWQAAAHMVWEGIDQPDLLQHGLAISRAIHDRYHARLRNPYNEIECSDHYARAMASYGVFQAACGFNCHGPRGHIEFAPRLSPDDFRAPFTCATGWGTLTQRRAGATQIADITLRWGDLTLRTIGLRATKNMNAKRVEVKLGVRAINATIDVADDRVTIELEQPVTIDSDQTMTVTLS